MLMLGLVGGTLFPIGWMIFCSLKDNNEILQGKVGLGRWDNDLRAIHIEGRNLWVGTADGGISRYQLGTWERLAYNNLSTRATNFCFEERGIWVSSGNKGLILLDKNSLKVIHRFDFDWDVFINEIAMTSVATDGERVWYGIWSSEPRGMVMLDLTSNSFERISVELQVTCLTVDEKRVYIGTPSGLKVFDKENGRIDMVREFPPLKVNTLLLCSNCLWVGTEDGLYQLGRRIDGLPSDQILSLLSVASEIWIGHTAGLTRYDPSTGRTESFTRLFQAFDKKGHPIAGGLITKEVLALGGDRDVIAVGTTRGRVSVFNSETMEPLAVLTLPKGARRLRWSNYVDLWRRINFALYFRNSVIVCGAVMFIAMFMASLAAYALSRFKFPGAGLFSNSILSTQIIPGIMFLIPIFLMFRKFHTLTGIPLIGTFPGLIFTYSAFFVPFSIWILRGFFASIPVELEDAAKIDGCSPFQTFLHIVLPLAMPGIIATGIYVFLTAWDELMFAWILTSADTMTIPVGIRTFIGNYQNRYDLMMAAATVSTLPVMTMFFLMQRRIVQGLTAGAVKG